MFPLNNICFVVVVVVKLLFDTYSHMALTSS